MFDQLLGGVQCHPSKLIGRGGEEEIVQARKSLSLLTFTCKLTTNGITQEPLVEWMRTIDVLLNTIMVLKPFSPMTIRFITF